MDVLSKLFGSAPLVKVMRLFLFQSDEAYDTALIIERTKISKDDARWILQLLEKIGFLKKKTFWKEVTVGKGKKQEHKKKRAKGYTLDEQFLYARPLRDLLIHTELLEDKEIERRLKKTGAIKLLIVAGVFINSEDARIDMLVVGDRLKQPLLERAIHTLEADIGTEIRYVILATSDFMYRKGVNDRLVRDVFDYTHHTIINKLDI